MELTKEMRQEISESFWKNDIDALEAINKALCLTASDREEIEKMNQTGEYDSLETAQKELVDRILKKMNDSLVNYTAYVVAHEYDQAICLTTSMKPEKIEFLSRYGICEEIILNQELGGDYIDIVDI